MRRSGCGLYPRRLSRPIAIVLLRGVFQVILSTPGVRLPEFSVTRRMARSLPLRERVSRCCKAFTLCHLPACIAFTIRAWSRLTLASATSQSVSSHGSVVVSRYSRETAPTVPCGPIDICNCLLRPLSSSLVMRHLQESARFRGGYPAHTRANVPGGRPIRPITGRLSLIHLLPTRTRHRWPCGFPTPYEGSWYGLNLFPVIDRIRFRSSLSTGGTVRPCPGDMATPGPPASPFGSSLSASLACS